VKGIILAGGSGTRPQPIANSLARNSFIVAYDRLFGFVDPDIWSV
jgi:dTDP-glucose pyrophosphorylase